MIITTRAAAATYIYKDEENKEKHRDAERELHRLFKSDHNITNSLFKQSHELLPSKNTLFVIKDKIQFNYFIL